MIEWPPGEPITMVSFPFSSNTRVGAIELRGRFFASTRLATGLPSSSGTQEKSVSSLLRKNPRTIWRLPNAASTLAVSATALPSASTMETCEVAGSSSGSASP